MQTHNKEDFIMKNYETPVLMLEEVNAQDVITTSELTTDAPFAYARFEF